MHFSRLCFCAKFQIRNLTIFHKKKPLFGQKLDFYHSVFSSLAIYNRCDLTDFWQSCLTFALLPWLIFLNSWEVSLSKLIPVSANVSKIVVKEEKWDWETQSFVQVQKASSSQCSKITEKSLIQQHCERSEQSFNSYI